MDLTVFRIGLLTSDILEGFSKRQSTVLLSIDFSKAFDRVNTQLMLYKLHKLGLKGRMLAWITDFLSNRKYRVVAPTQTEHTEFDNGTPQGSSLSALLFILYTDSLLKSLDKLSVKNMSSSLHNSGYADDVAAWTTDKDASVCTTRLNQAIKVIERWRNRWRLPISAEKTSFTLFTRRRISLNDIPDIRIDGKVISHKENPRFLVVVFDPKLTWSANIDQLTTTCYKKINALRSLLGTFWRHHRKALVASYKAFIRPNLEYASEVWGSAAKSHLRKLDTV